MLLEIYIIFSVITIGLFFLAFFTHQEIVWALSAVFSGFMMYSSWGVEYYVYTFNTTISAYQPVAISTTYAYMVGIFMIFFSLSTIIGIYDIFDKYGGDFVDNNDSDKY